jgi:hypothetical protein
MSRFELSVALAALAILSAATPVFAQGPDVPRITAKATAALLPAAKRVVARRYMSGPGAKCEPTALAGYENLPTQRCSYKRGRLTGEVVLLDPAGWRRRGRA